MEQNTLLFCCNVTAINYVYTQMANSRSMFLLRNSFTYETYIENILFYVNIVYILRGTKNLSFVLGRSLLRTFETIWILVITLECSNITASKSIRRERKMRPMELSGVNVSTHGSESECSCFDQVLCIRV